MNETPDEKVYVLNREELEKNLIHYRNVVNCLGANVPIACLCLPKKIENILVKAGFILVYDLLYRDFRKIKGIGDGAFDLIRDRIADFGTMSI